MRKYKQPIVIRGLIANSDLRSGITKYSNPSQRDALMNANRMLLNANMQVNVCFLPESPLLSGGIASALTALSFKADGSFDVKAERKMDRDIARSHFGDIYKYFSWYALPPVKWNPKDTDQKRKIASRPKNYTRQVGARRSGWIN